MSRSKTPDGEARQPETQPSRPTEGLIMRGMHLGSLALALIIFTSTLRGQEKSWPAVPVAPAKQNVPPADSSALTGVSLERPVALPNSKPLNDVPIAQSGDNTDRPSVVRGQSADPPGSKPKLPSIWG